MVFRVTILDAIISFGLTRSLLRINKKCSNDALKVNAFPIFSLEGAARIWLEKEPSFYPYMEDLVSKVVELFLYSFEGLRIFKNDITNFQQKFKETFSEVWGRFKELLRKCPHHGFSELHQIDTFYNALTQFDQDSLNATAGDEICMTCGGPHPYYECLATDSNTFNAYAATGTYNQGGLGYRPQGDPNYRASNQIGPPGFPPSKVQNNQNYNRYNQNQAPNNQGRGQNFNQGNNNYQAPNYQAQVRPSNELSNYMKTNDVNMRAMQNQINNMTAKFKNEVQTMMRNQSNELKNDIKNMMSSFFQMRNPSCSGSLPSNTVANLKGDVKAITT
ncbi:reverse transcriptase domain-containing protein [Tanacetum coccineum]